MNYQLTDILKKKGIGPEGSKSLKTTDLAIITELFKSEEESLTTKATLLTALLLLEPNADELQWLVEVKNHPHHYLPEALVPFVTYEKSNSTLVELIRKLILKTELSEEECIMGMSEIFNPDVPEYLKGPFLEAERLKRESFDENKAFYKYLWRESSRKEIDIPLLIDISDNYDGNARTLTLSPFVAALLAAAGFPTYLHGVDKVAPKEGITAHQVLLAGGKNPLNSIEAVAEDLMNREIGWGYIDQQVFFPALYHLKKVRKEMVKRPFLATFEKLLQPLHCTKDHLLITGFTHTHYKTEVIQQLAHQGKCSKAIAIKGSEGSTGISLSKDTNGMYYDGKNTSELTFQVQNFNIPPLEYRVQKNLIPEDSLKEGLEALNNIDNYAKYNILYTASSILTSFELATPQIYIQLEECLKSGKALSHFMKGCRNF